MTAGVKRRELIIRLYQEKPGSSQKTIARKAKVAQQTVSDVIKYFKERLQVTRKVGSGRKKGRRNLKIAKKVLDSLTTNPEASNRILARKVGCAEGTVRNIKRDAGLRTYKVQTVPVRDVAKNVKAKKNEQ